jgi:hypothetical protein
MNLLFDEASDRAILEVFHRGGSTLTGERLQLRALRQIWADTGLRAADLPMALNRLIDARLIDTCITDEGPALLLTRAGQREVEESFGRGRSRGEDWMAEITLCILQRRGSQGMKPAVERRAA